MELWSPWQHIPPIDLTLEKSCHHPIAASIFFRSPSFLQNRFVHSGVSSPWALENLAIDLKWGKYCHYDSDFDCFQIDFNLAGDQQRQEISVELNYEQNQIIPFGVTCP